ncbi:tripartite tricarboxylate transporter substrate binding protein [Streptomyces radicis]|uniref:tripartite tricarboxylate transporter substrate binding protein n=1 Tax=Streptomyces radicis TaxID=1750517 RepID=UPI001E347494|nr:tripartite tricarboxylate transporter substrate-binding protein [Streptomyces radicis]
MRARALASLLAAALLVFLVPPLVSSDDSGGGGTDIPGLRFLVPNEPGGGYDITARTAARAAEEAELTGSIEVFNLPGAGGTVGLSHLVAERGNGRLAMSMGLGVVGAVHTNHTDVTLADTTPLARLTEEPDIVVVPADSPYEDIDDMLADWRANPGSLPFGGGSSPGGPDHLASMLMAGAAGVTPRSANYVAYDGGGELLAAILGGEVAFGVSGVGEYLDQIEAGELRVLAVTGPERSPGIDAPTLQEAGLDVEFTNWRGIVAPPGLTEAERDRLVALLTELHGSPQWSEALTRNGWADAFLTGDEFGDFLESQNSRVDETLRELGL